MAISALELLFIGLAIVVAARLLWHKSASKILFVMVGVLGLFMLLFFFMAAPVNTEIRRANQVTDLPIEGSTRSAQVVTVKRVDSAPVAQAPVAQAPVAQAPQTKAPGIVLEEEKSKESRPTWVDAPTGLVDSKYEKTVSAGPFDTPSSCEVELLSELRKAVSQYVDEYIAPGAGKAVMFTDYELMQFSPRRWIQHAQTTVGPMLYYHSRLTIDDAARKEMKVRWHQEQIEHRLVSTGTVVGAVLVVLSAAYWGLQMRSPRRLSTAGV